MNENKKLMNKKRISQIFKIHESRLDEITNKIDNLHLEEKNKTFFDIIIYIKNNFNDNEKELALYYAGYLMERLSTP